MRSYACIVSDTTVADDGQSMWLQVDEVASMLCLTRGAVTHMAKNGRIPGAFQPAKRWLFRRDLFEAWVEANTTKPAEA